MGILDKLLSKRAAPTHSVAELEDAVVAARAAAAQCRDATEEARAKFDERGDDGSLDALTEARLEEDRAIEHVGRVERLLDAARGRDAAAERAKLEERRDALRAELAPERQREAARPLAVEEAALLVELAKLRERRRKSHHALKATEAELARVCKELGDRGAPVAATALACSPHLVLEELEKTVGLTESETHFLRKLRPEHSDYDPR